MTLSYHQVHHWIPILLGDASEYPCAGCGGLATDWCYQHNAPEGKELYHEGSPYTEDVRCYKPMCFGCHWKLDDVPARMSRTHLTRLEEDPERAERYRLRGLAVAAWMADRLQTDEEFKRYRQAIGSRSIQQANASLRRCDDCGVEMNPGALGMHQKHLVHSGWTKVLTDEEREMLS